MSDREALEAKIKAARERRTELEQARAEQAKIARLQSELEAEERAVKHEEVLAALVAEHGPLGVNIEAVTSDVGIVVVKRPHHLHFKRYTDKDAPKSHDLEELVRTVLVYPKSWADFEKMVEDRPALLVRVGNAVVRLAGLGREDIAGK